MLCIDGQSLLSHNMMSNRCTFAASLVSCVAQSALNRSTPVRPAPNHSLSSMRRFDGIQFPLINSVTFDPQFWAALWWKLNYRLIKSVRLRGLSHARALNWAESWFNKRWVNKRELYSKVCSKPSVAVPYLCSDWPALYRSLLAQSCHSLSSQQ
jgi:hypothetical protein